MRTVTAKTEDLNSRGGRRGVQMHTKGDCHEQARVNRGMGSGGGQPCGPCNAHNFRLVVLIRPANEIRARGIRKSSR